MKDKKICCICKKPFEGYGNNPAPVMDGGECCDKCNADVVLPIRLAQAVKVRAAVMTKTNKESKYIVACQNCTLPACKCKGDCTRKQILKNAANAVKTAAKNGK